jgi:hypothetical protein
MDRNELARFTEQSAESERQRAGLIKAEVESGLAFARLAEIEYSFRDLITDRPRAINDASQALGNARTSYQVVLKHLPEIKLSEQDEQEVEVKLRILEQAFARLSEAMRIANSFPEKPPPYPSRRRSSKRKALRHSKKG